MVPVEGFWCSFQFSLFVFFVLLGYFSFSRVAVEGLCVDIVSMLSRARLSSGVGFLVVGWLEACYWVVLSIRDVITADLSYCPASAPFIAHCKFIVPFIVPFGKCILYRSVVEKYAVSDLSGKVHYWFTIGPPLKALWMSLLIL